LVKFKISNFMKIYPAEERGGGVGGDDEEMEGDATCYYTDSQMNCCVAHITRQSVFKTV
jgi:hypothetical protein